MRDILPDEMERVRLVEDVFADLCRDWGYREVRTPAIEPLHLFTAAGTLSPQTLDRVYSFLDWDGWSGERVVLRPDSTIPSARLYVEHLDGGRIAKLFYNQSVFRFTDDGAPREEQQCGIELIGASGPTGDMELILVALEMLKQLNVVEVTLRLSHAGIVRGILAAAGMTADEQSAAYDRLLDGDLTVVDEAERRLPQLNAPLRLLFEVEGSGSAYISNVREALGAGIPSIVGALEELGHIAAALEASGRTPAIRSVLARSFEYYSGIVMSLESRGVRIGGGGRYDELVGLIGGRGVPASGFALYPARIAQMIEPARSRVGQPRLVLQAEGESAALLAATFGASKRLREAGLHVEAVEGMHSLPTHRVICREASPKFTLVWPDGREDFERIDDIARVLETD